MPAPKSAISSCQQQSYLFCFYIHLDSGSPPPPRAIDLNLYENIEDILIVIQSECK